MGVGVLVIVLVGEPDSVGVGLGVGVAVWFKQESTYVGVNTDSAVMPTTSTREPSSRE